MHHAATRPPSLPVMIDITTISTPRQAAIVATVGKIEPAVVKQAEEARVRAVPMLDANGACLGAISLQKMGKLLASKTPLTPDHATFRCAFIPHLVPVLELLKLLAEHGMIMHRADPDADDYQTDWFGIVTTADLNRPIFRAHIYQMLVILETSLGHLIMDEFGDDWGAIRLLSDHTQRRIREFYDEERAEGIDLSPVTNATLSDLFHIATESNRVWSLMGFDSPNQLREVGHRISDIRNRIMHPVRPLIVNERELTEIVAGVEDIETVTTTLMKLIGVSAG